MTKAKHRVPAISSSHKLPVTLSSPSHLKLAEKVGQAVSEREAGWDPMGPADPVSRWGSPTLVVVVHSRAEVSLTP